jgi:hypothetical protein
LELPEPPSIGSGLKLLANPAGALEESVTEPVNPLSETIEIFELEEVPTGMRRLDLEAVSVKSGGGRTVRTRLTECAPRVAFPVNMTV